MGVAMNVSFQVAGHDGFAVGTRLRQAGALDVSVVGNSAEVEVSFTLPCGVTALVEVVEGLLCQTARYDEIDEIERGTA
jgi:hypothetical protein